MVVPKCKDCGEPVPSDYIYRINRGYCRACIWKHEKRAWIKVLPKIKPTTLKVELELEMVEDRYGNALMGGHFKITRAIQVGHQIRYEKVARGYLSPRSGTVKKLFIYQKYRSKDNEKYIRKKIETLQFDFMAREMDNITGRRFTTDMRRLYIG